MRVVFLLQPLRVPLSDIPLRLSLPVTQDVERDGWEHPQWDRND